MPRLRPLPKALADRLLPPQEAWQLLLQRAAAAGAADPAHADAACGGHDGQAASGSIELSGSGAGGGAEAYKARGDGAGLAGLPRKLEVEGEGCAGVGAGDSLFSAVAQLLSGQASPSLPRCSPPPVLTGRAVPCFESQPHAAPGGRRALLSLAAGSRADPKSGSPPAPARCTLPGVRPRRARVAFRSSAAGGLSTRAARPAPSGAACARRARRRRLACTRRSGSAPWPTPSPWLRLRCRPPSCRRRHSRGTGCAAPMRPCCTRAAGASTKVAPKGPTTKQIIMTGIRKDRLERRQPGTLEHSLCPLAAEAEAGAWLTSQSPV